MSLDRFTKRVIQMSLVALVIVVSVGATRDLQENRWRVTKVDENVITCARASEPTHTKTVPMRLISPDLLPTPGDACPEVES